MFKRIVGNIGLVILFHILIALNSFLVSYYCSNSEKEKTDSVWKTILHSFRIQQSNHNKSEQSYTILQSVAVVMETRLYNMLIISSENDHSLLNSPKSLFHTMWVWFVKDSINNVVSWVLMLVYFWKLIKEVFLKIYMYFFLFSKGTLNWSKWQ